MVGQPAGQQAEEPHEVLGLIVEWFDPQPQLVRQYVLKFFTKFHEVEMVDRKTRRLFLKKTACPPHLTPKDLFVGNRINLFGRILTVVDYADPFTKKLLQSGQQKSVGVVTPDAFHVLGQILNRVSGKGPRSAGLQLAKVKMVQLSELQGEDLGKLLGVSNNLRAFAAGLAKGPTVGFTVIGEDAVERLTEAAEAVRKEHGAGGNELAIMWATNEPQARALSDFFFSGKLPSTATFDSCTCAVIRPHAVKEGDAGSIIDLILEQGYQISALESFNLDISAAKEFLEVYKGVVPEYADMAEELTEGPCIALEVRAEHAVETFRQTAGPWDVEIAKELRPKTVRARFGHDRVRNALHCTDMPEDGELECRYFFDILQQPTSS